MLGITKIYRRRRRIPPRLKEVVASCANEKVKKLIIMLLIMVGAFCGLWAYKMSNPASSLNAYAYGVDHESGAWWNIDYSQTSITADSSWKLDPEIPQNYIPVLGYDELYMVIDEHGNIIGYRQRVRQPDGSWHWYDVNPDIPEGWMPVPGLDNVYMMVDENGVTRYFRYHRNADDTFYFEEVDENGNPLRQWPDGSIIPDNFRRVTGNIYAVYNEHGVIIGYMERVLNPDGTYTWVEVDEPEIPDSQGVEVSARQDGGGQQQGGGGFYIPFQLPGQGGGNVIMQDPGISISSVPRESGGYIETETHTESKIQGGFTIISETTITREYNKDGILIATRRDGPHEISRIAVVPGADPREPNPALIEATISAEYTRVTSGISFDTQLANDVLAHLNATRARENLAPLAMASGAVYQAAAIKAADMAIYNHSDFESPMYGSIRHLYARFGITSALPSETLWRTTEKTAEQIHERFQIQMDSYNTRMSSQHSEVAIAIAVSHGFIFIAEVFA